MLAESSIYPAEIRLEKVSAGIATIRVRWDIQGVLIDEKLSYRYEEAIITKELPASYVTDSQTVHISTRQDVENYLEVVKDEIISQAKMSIFEV